MIEDLKNFEQQCISEKDGKPIIKANGDLSVINDDPLDTVKSS